MVAGKFLSGRQNHFLFTHSVTHLFFHPPTSPFTLAYSSTRPPILLTQSFTHVPTFSLIHALVCSLTYQPTQPHVPTYLTSHQLCYSFNDSLTQSPSHFQTTAHVPTLPPNNSLYSLTLSLGNHGDMVSTYMFFICDGI